MVQQSPLKIIVCTKRDIAGAIILNRILPRLTNHQVMVFLSDKTRDAEVTIPELSVLKYLERDLPINAIFPLVDALGDEKCGSKLTFKALSRTYQIPFHVVDDINSPRWLGMVRDFTPDIILSVRFSNVFRADIIDVPKVGIYNIHPGALPYYAGLFPSFRALLNNETKIGATLHRVDNRIDAGPILGIGWTDVVPEKGLLWHVFKSYNAGLDHFVDILPRLSAGDVLEETPQDNSKRAYRSMPKPEDVKQFVDRGLQLFDPATYSQTLAEFMPSDMGGRHASKD